MPLYHDLNTEEGCQAFGLSREDIKRAHVEPIRVREGDDASCLNLNRAQTPRLLGVRPDSFSRRQAFSFVDAVGPPPSDSSAWSLLTHEHEGASYVPAVADFATIKWALGKSVGDTMEFQGEGGESFTIRFVGALANSIFQGSLLISEDDFLEHYPSESGYRMLLVDSLPAVVANVRETLGHSLEDVGIDLARADERLGAFMTVQNTYLAIFTALGGLGLILGSAGLGAILLRNVMERRGELALMRAVGFTVASVRWLILCEHWFILFLGLSVGSVAGAVASLPRILHMAGGFPFTSLTITLFGIAVSGGVCIIAATHWAMKGHLLGALRND